MQESLEELVGLAKSFAVRLSKRVVSLHGCNKLPLQIERWNKCGKFVHKTGAYCEQPASGMSPLNEILSAAIAIEQCKQKLGEDAGLITSDPNEMILMNAICNRAVPQSCTAHFLSIGVGLGHPIGIQKGPL